MTYLQRVFESDTFKETDGKFTDFSWWLGAIKTNEIDNEKDRNVWYYHYSSNFRKLRTKYSKIYSRYDESGY